ncbi:MAG: PRC-barrel domain-containing protein [Verrucomicrobia bacterium]|nr:PRC-barrel domain-containing protein [Verrucomicrobiota bacterium]
MLSKAKTLKGYKLDSLDGEIGEVKEFYFDDRHWTIRYLVADTGKWLTGRKVLISPYALNRVVESEKHLSVDLTKKQIEKSPPLSTHKPVSQQFEEDYYGYYGWPAYWGGSSVWGNSTYLERDRTKRRSTHEVTGYHLQALDGELGHIEDFVIDDETWTIRYLIVGTKNWWPGKRVLVSPHWMERVSWSESKVFINLSLETIKESPPFTEDSLLTRDYEVGLHRHYNRKGYWMDELAAL